MCELGFSSRKQKTKSSSESDPWDVATPYIEDFLKTNVSPLVSSRATTPNATERRAFNQLTRTAQAGNPYADDIDSLTNDLFGTQSRAPMVDSAYSDLTRRLSPVADGQNMNLENDPYLQSMLARVREDATTAANETFAGAGREFSGAHAGAIGESVADAQLPYLMQAYQMQTGRTDAAARDLNTAASGAATTGGNLDQQALVLRQMGIDTGGAALDAKNWGPNTVLAIQEKLRAMPVEQAARIAAILFPAGQLGEQSTGKSSTKQSGFNIGFAPKFPGIPTG